jgi:hypothetical protein
VQLARTVRPLLKRGGFLVAANWPVIVVQFVAESAFKLVLAVPVIAGALLVAMSLGGDLVELLGGELRESAAIVAGALLEHPAALASFVVAFAIVLLGGSALMFVVKAGTVWTLVHAERGAGPIERPPLRMAAFRQADHFSIERFLEGCGRLWRRYLRLGAALLAAYALSGALYLLVVYVVYRLSGAPGAMIGWTAAAAVCATMLVVWITLVNLVYLLLQMVMAAEDVSVRRAVIVVREFITARSVELGLAFGVLLVLVVTAMAASLLATAALGLISFVPFAGFAVFPLQIVAWVVRGMVFQYLGLTALATYATSFRRFREGSGDIRRMPSSRMRTA